MVVMDGHTAHTNNWAAIEALISAGIQVVLIPSHTSHYLQPLDKNPFSQFKFYWNYHLEDFNRRNSGKVLNNESFFQVFNIAWHKGVTPHTVRVGFKRCGLEPLDRTMITEEMLEVSTCFSESLVLFRLRFGCVSVAFSVTKFPTIPIFIPGFEPLKHKLMHSCYASCLCRVRSEGGPTSCCSTEGHPDCCCCQTREGEGEDHSSCNCNSCPATPVFR